MAKCKHDITQRSTAAEVGGLCPLCLQAELADIKLELSTPSTMGLDKEPLYKWAALIVCEGHLLRAEVEQHRWVSVSERLPKESGNYQVVREINRFPTTREYCAKSLMWLSHDIVTHWKPIILPKQTLKER